MGFRTNQVSFVFCILLIYQTISVLPWMLNNFSGNVVVFETEIMTKARKDEIMIAATNLLNGGIPTSWKFPNGTTLWNDNSTSTNNRYHTRPRSTSSSKSKYAYAYVVGGCDPTPDNMIHYRTFIYNILISVSILREYGSTADVVVFLQMAKGYTNATRLPSRDMELLKANQIRTFYIPPSKDANFFSLMIDKFRILSLTEYDRVLYMDSDVMPITNLDYLFHHSAQPNGQLEENVVNMGLAEPANGGFFMLKPNRTHLHQLNDIVRYRQQQSKTMRKPYFDKYIGWGHVITPPDKWETLKPSLQGTNWTFWAAFADQGLLYHWTKYVRKRVSILRNNLDVQNFRPEGPNGTVVLAETVKMPLLWMNSSQQDDGRRQQHEQRRIRVNRVHRCARTGIPCPMKKDFFHFSGDKKPWFQPFPHDVSNATKLQTYVHFWYWKLQQINQQFNLGIQHQLVVNQSLAGDFGKHGGTIGRHPVFGLVKLGNIELDTHYEVYA